MGEYWKPATKKDLIIWIQRQYWNAGQCTAGLDRKPIKQLWAIYYELIRRIKEPVQL